MTFWILGFQFELVVLDQILDGDTVDRLVDDRFVNF